MKPIELREADFKKDVWEFCFPESIKTEFFEYWTEPNKSGTKMRFEMEKTWHLGRRIARWANNGFGSVKNHNHSINAVSSKKEHTEPTNDYERLDDLLGRYLKSPVSVHINEFRAWYDFMKDNSLLKELSEDEKRDLKNVYGQDGNKLKSAWVMKTLDGYANSGLRVSDLVKMRQTINQ